MVTVSQIQKGFVRFIDTEVAGAFDKWQKVVVIGAATLLATNLPKLIVTYSTHPMISAFGVLNPENGNIDIDALYDAFVPNMGTDKIPLTIPKIGTIKLGKDEIDILCRYIKEA